MNLEPQYSRAQLRVAALVAPMAAGMLLSLNADARGGSLWKDLGLGFALALLEATVLHGAILANHEGWWALLLPRVLTAALLWGWIGPQQDAPAVSWLSVVLACLFGLLVQLLTWAGWLILLWMVLWTLGVVDLNMAS